MKDFIAINSAEIPFANFFLSENKAYTYKKTERKVSKIAGAIVKFGIKKRSRVAFAISNNFEGILFFLSLIRIQAKIILLNPNLKLGELIENIQYSKADYLITSGECEVNGVPVKKFNYDELLVADAKPIESQSLSLNDQFLVIFTSGTTLEPKAVELSLNNFYYSSISSAYRLGKISEDKWVCPLPLYHIGGISIIFRTLVNGTSMMVQDEFSVKGLIRMIEKEKGNMVSLVPTMLFRIFKESKISNLLRKFRVILIGGSKTHEELIERSKELNLKLFISYGMTEATSQISTATPKMIYSHPSAVGIPLSCLEVVCNRNDMIAIKGASLMLRYLKKNKLKAYFETGDTGKLNKLGLLYIISRRKEIIISGGMNINLRKIEEYLLSYPGIEEAVAFSIPDREWGELFCTVIKTKLEEKEIKKYLALKFNNYEIPKIIIILNKIPRNKLGKINYRNLIKIAKNFPT